MHENENPPAEWVNTTNASYFSHAKNAPSESFVGRRVPGASELSVASTLAIVSTRSLLSAEAKGSAGNRILYRMK